MTSPKDKPRKPGRPRVNPPGTRVWTVRLTPAEIAACRKLVAQMRKK